MAMMRENKIVVVTGVSLLYVAVWLFGAKLLAEHAIETTEMIPVAALLGYVVLGGVVGSVIPISLWQTLSLEDEDEITGEPL